MRSKFIWRITLLLALVVQLSFAQEKTVTGNVTDQDGLPLPGVSIQVRGTNIGTQTDFDGNYTINVSQGQVLVFTYIGLKDEERTVGASNTVNVQMQEDAQVLEGVVVTGFGETTRKALTTSIASVEGETIKGIATATVTGALQGSTTGVSVNQNSGTPGTGFSVRIRGASSINGSNEPLYVVDGIPLLSGGLGGGGFGGQDNDALATLNFADVESIQVLKDAAATAIYGSRAANGVVLITTRRGKAGKVQVEINNYTGFQEEINRYEVLTAGEYFLFADTAIFNGFGLEGFVSNGGLFGRNGLAESGAASLEELYASDFGDNFIDAIYRNGSPIIRQTDISISGGSQQATFFAQFSDFDQAGVIENQDFGRRSLRLNVDFKPNEKFNLDAGVSVTESRTSRINSDNNIFGALTTAVLERPGLNLRDEFGTFVLNGFQFSNPLQNAVEENSNETTLRYLTNIGLRYNFTKTLSLYSRVNLERIDFRQDRFFPATSAQGIGSNGDAQATINLFTNYNSTTTLNYSETFGDFNVTGLLGFTFEGLDTNSTFVNTQDFPAGFNAVTAGAAVIDANNNNTERLLFSYVARGGLSWKNRLFFEGTVRADASSVFGDGNQIGYFPAFSGAYTLSEEDWFDNNFLTNLKFRASWGQTGNQAGLGNFASSFLANGVQLDGAPGTSITQLGNSSLQWEVTTQTNFDVDLTLWDRVNITYEYYERDTDELLLGRPLRLSSGFGAITDNVGSLENTGHDIAVSADIFRGKFSWTAQVNLSFNENEVTELVRDENGVAIPIDTGFASRTDEGQPLGSFFGLIFDGIFRPGDEIPAPLAAQGVSVGDVRFVDLNGDGNIDDANDRTFIGNPNPGLVGNFRNTFRYAGFDLSFNWQFEADKDLYNATQQFAGPTGSITFNKLSNANDFFDINTNPDSNVPQPRFGALQAFNNQDSTLFVENGAYLRLKEIVFGYTFTPKVLGSSSTVRVYLGADNLVTLTNYSGLDPEVSTFGTANVSRGTDFFTLGLNQTYKFGVNLKF